jgi:protein-tyrosine-phosphatase
MTADRMRVLFLCTGNSARSQMAEAILRRLSKGAVEAASAGSRPRAEIHPLAREAVRTILGLEMTGQEPKPVDRYLGERFDYVITVCDRAAESCPAFPGADVVRWSLPDPAEAAGTDAEKRRAFENSAKDLIQRIRLWLSLPDVSARVRASAARV